MARANAFWGVGFGGGSGDFSGVVGGSGGAAAPFSDGAASDGAGAGLRGNGPSGRGMSSPKCQHLEGTAQFDSRPGAGARATRFRFARVQARHRATDAKPPLAEPLPRNLRGRLGRGDPPSECPRRAPRRRRDRPSDASPSEYPRRGRGVAATRPRRRRHRADASNLGRACTPASRGARRTRISKATRVVARPSRRLAVEPAVRVRLVRGDADAPAVVDPLLVGRERRRRVGLVRTAAGAGVRVRVEGHQVRAAPAPQRHEPLVLANRYDLDLGDLHDGCSLRPCALGARAAVLDPQCALCGVVGVLRLTAGSCSATPRHYTPPRRCLATQFAGDRRAEPWAKAPSKVAQNLRGAVDRPAVVSAVAV